MKILFAIKSLTPPGGAERVLVTVASVLATRGHEVWLASYDSEDAKSFYTLGPGVNWLKCGGNGTTGKATLSGMLARMRLLRKASKRIRPDVGVGFMHSVFVPFGWALVGMGIPVIASDHIGYHYYRDLFLERTLVRLSKPFVSVTTVISDAIRDSFPPALQRKTIVIPNPVEPALAREEGAADRRKARRTVLSIGRLENQKDQKTLVEAFARIAGEYVDWDLKIVGEGHLRPHLERLIMDLAMTDRITLPGTTSWIGKVYEQADLFVIPSLFESFGLVTAEALAHGVPVVGFADCPGTNEIIHCGENGILVTGSDRVTALSEAMASLMSSPELRQRLGAAGPASVARFYPEAVVDLWEQLLTDVLNDKKWT